MLTMSQINHIKDLSNCGYRISEISEKTGADPKTIRKYLAQDDFSPRPPVIQEKPSKLDPFKPIIQEWLDEDKKHWRKQHHTAQRIYERLVEEHGYTGSYSTVQRYMKKCRSIQTEKASLELIWDPGPAHKIELRTEREKRHVKQKKKHPNIILCYSRGKEANPPKDDSVKDQKHGSLS